MKLPFNCEIIETEPTYVQNEFTGKGCKLEPEALAVYDTIKGAEMLGITSIMRKGIDWFIKHYPNEYMTLLN